MLHTKFRGYRPACSREEYFCHIWVWLSFPLPKEALHKRWGSILYEIYIGFCPRIDFHNIMHIDCLTYDYSICDIVYLLPIYMSKKRDVM